MCPDTDRCLDFQKYFYSFQLVHRVGLFCFFVVLFFVFFSTAIPLKTFNQFFSLLQLVFFTVVDYWWGAYAVDDISITTGHC